MTLETSEQLLTADMLRRLERVQISSKIRPVGVSRGDRRSRQRGTSMQLVDYREYTAGDDPRQVDWNAYGRSGNLYVKLYEDEVLLDVHLCVDVSRSMDWGEPNKLEQARRIAAGIGYVGLARFDRVYATPLDDMVGTTLGQFWGRDQASRLFRGLRAWSAQRTTDLATALRAYTARIGRHPGLVVVISDLLSPTWEEGLRALVRNRHEIVLIHLLAPEEVRPPMGEELRLVDRETGQAVEIHLDAYALDQYARRFASWTTAIERFCIDHGATLVRVDSDTPVETVLFETLRRRRVLA